MAEHTDIPLRQHYPLSIRLILVRSFHWVIVFVIVLILISAVDHLMAGREPGLADRVFYYFATALVLGGILALALKFIYEIFHFLLYDYKVESQQLVISKGVFWRSRATFPLVKLTDVYVERNPLELVFFVSTLQVTTAAALSGVNFGGIEGLPSSTAKALQTFVTDLASTVQPEVKEEKAEKILSDNLPPEKSSLDTTASGLVERKQEADAEVGADQQKLDEALHSLVQAEESIKQLKAELEPAQAENSQGESQEERELKREESTIPAKNQEPVQETLDQIALAEEKLKTIRAERQPAEAPATSARANFSGRDAGRDD